jgi:hypothetical protein
MTERLIGPNVEKGHEFLHYKKYWKIISPCF